VTFSQVIDTIYTEIVLEFYMHIPHRPCSPQASSFPWLAGTHMDDVMAGLKGGHIVVRKISWRSWFFKVYKHAHVRHMRLYKNSKNAI